MLTLSGAVTGAMYSLVAVGLVLSYSTSGIFNFSHAAVAYATAVVFYELHSGLGWPIGLSAVVTIVVVAPGLGWCSTRWSSASSSGLQSTKIVATVGALVALPPVRAVDRRLLHPAFDANSTR